MWTRGRASSFSSSCSSRCSESWASRRRRSRPCWPAAGIAIGAAWSGLLSNFAAGLFLLTFRPFRVGDSIAAAGVTGTVREIGLFVTMINTPDNVLTFVGNNKLFSENLQNFSANPFRRVDLTAYLPSTANVEATMARLRERVRAVPHVLADPEPLVQVQTLSQSGVALSVRPFCHHDHYWQVYFDANRAIVEVLLQGTVEADDRQRLHA